MARQSEKSGVDYEALAEGVDEIRETMRACIAGLMADGFTEEQARALIVGIFARNYKRADEEDS